MLRVLILVLALGAAGGAAWFASTRVATQTAAPAPAPEGPAMAQVLVAADAVPTGEALRAPMLEWRDWPEAAVAETFITRAARPDAVVELTGAFARTGFVAGEPIVEAGLARGGAGFLAAILRPGERAFAVRVSAENTAGGFILPGDRVDVLLTRSMVDAEGIDRSDTDTILRNIEVLAIDQRAGAQESDAVIGKTATLRVEATQAERLAAAEIAGRLSLALRASADRDAPVPAPEPEPVEVAAAEPAPEPMPTVRVRRAGVAEIVSLP